MQCRDIHIAATADGREDERREGGRTLRVVHISDTHLLHSPNQLAIPDGDILIHSGDFAQARWFNALPTHGSENERQLDGFLEFLRSLPHRRKVFVCGNHEVMFMRSGWRTIQRKLGDDVIYLQDWGVDIDGLRIYGSPWNRTNGAYGASQRYRESAWRKIPNGTDVVVTHMGAQGVLDQCYRKGKGPRAGHTCGVCGKAHPDSVHEGCSALGQEVARAGASVHLFGHSHECNGTQEVGSVLCVNSAMAGGGDGSGLAHYFDVHLPPSRGAGTVVGSSVSVRAWSPESGWQQTAALSSTNSARERKATVDSNAGCCVG